MSTRRTTLYTAIFSAFAGALIGAIVWGFMRLMALGTGYIWDVIPQHLTSPVYTLLICAAGGLLFGLFQKRFGVYPDELSEVMTAIKRDHFYAYNKMPVLLISAMVPLLLGAAVGPEAGLTGIITALCYWAGDHMKRFGRSEALGEMGIAAALGVIFVSPLFGLALPMEARTDSDEATVLPKTKQWVLTLIAVLAAFGVMWALRSVFGAGAGMPRIDAPTITNRERLWGVPLAFFGAAFGYVFLFSHKAMTALFTKIQKHSQVLSTFLGGVALGLIGMGLPLTMFSGEEQIEILEHLYPFMAPGLLIGIGVVKLVLTNICIASGLRGGHFFPMIFAGIAIGYGTALLTGLNPAFTTAVITASLLGLTMKKPLAVTFLLLLCFPIRVTPWLIAGAFIGSLLPTGKQKAPDAADA